MITSILQGAGNYQPEWKAYFEWLGASSVVKMFLYTVFGQNMNLVERNSRMGNRKTMVVNEIIQAIVSQTVIAY